MAQYNNFGIKHCLRAFELTEPGLKAFQRCVNRRKKSRLPPPKGFFVLTLPNMQHLAAKHSYKLLLGTGTKPLHEKP